MQSELLAGGRVGLHFIRAGFKDVSENRSSAGDLPCWLLASLFLTDYVSVSNKITRCMRSAERQHFALSEALCAKRCLRLCMFLLHESTNTVIRFSLFGFLQTIQSRRRFRL